MTPGRSTEPIKCPKCGVAFVSSGTAGEIQTQACTCNLNGVAITVPYSYDKTGSRPVRDQ